MSANAIIENNRYQELSSGPVGEKGALKCIAEKVTEIFFGILLAICYVPILLSKLVEHIQNPFPPTLEKKKEKINDLGWKIGADLIRLLTSEQAEKEEEMINDLIDQEIGRYLTQHRSMFINTMCKHENFKASVIEILTINWKSKEDAEDIFKARMKENLFSEFFYVVKGNIDINNSEVSHLLKWFNFDKNVLNEYSEYVKRKKGDSEVLSEEDPSIIDDVASRLEQDEEQQRSAMLPEPEMRLPAAPVKASQGTSQKGVIQVRPPAPESRAPNVPELAQSRAFLVRYREQRKKLAEYRPGNPPQPAAVLQNPPQLVAHLPSQAIQDPDEARLAGLLKTAGITYNPYPDSDKADLDQEKIRWKTSSHERWQDFCQEHSKYKKGTLAQKRVSKPRYAALQNPPSE